jgi:hypothetical protein
VWSIEHYGGVHISYAASEIASLKVWRFNDVTISGKTDHAVYIEEAVIYPSFALLHKAQVSARCEAKGVRLFKTLPFFDALTELLSIEPFSETVVESVRVEVAVTPATVRTNNLRAIGKDIKIFGHGAVNTKEHTLDYDLKILLSKNITAAMPEAVKMTLLKEEDADWMAARIRTAGDYRKPQLRFQSDLLRVNIQGVAIR